MSYGMNHLIRHAMHNARFDAKLQTSLAGALEYARYSIPVFPVRETGKTPKIKRWQTKATTHAMVIEQLWGQWPRANVGVATGNRLVVLDADSRKAAAAIG